MKIAFMIGILSVAALAPLANALHLSGCTPTYAPWNTIDKVGSYYIERRDHGIVDRWIYEESNPLEGLQRAGVGLFGDLFPPGCDPNWRVTINPWGVSVPFNPPCLYFDEDPINDETCTHGPDTIIL